MQLKVNKNLERRRYETEVKGYTAFVEYIKAKDAMYLTHTEVPVQLEGNGVGSALVKHVLSELQEQDIKVAPLCPFVASYIRQHPDYKPLVARGYNVG